ncbi:MAG TPA: hypothetical protein ENO16_04145, partial [Chromatiales bacterium]|nr:hypothetical protein [Chromatiales bacterium]
MRKLALALACASILGTSTAQAMGLGEMAVRSYLNQPLRAEIPLTDVSASELEQIRASFASARAFDEQGLSLSAVAGRIQVQLQGGKHPRIVLTSSAPVRDPVLGVVLEVEGPDGVLQRAYDILLDPVTYRPPQPVVSAVSGRPATAAAGPTAPIVKATPAGTAETSGAKLKGSVEDGRYIVRRGETLWRIAYNLRPDGVSTEQMMAALRAANPQAFVDPSRDETLLSGASLRIPALAEIRSAKVVKAPVPAADKMEAEPAALPAAAPAVETAEVPAEPRVAIVAPAQPVAPVVGEVVTPPVVAPVVGEVITPHATTGEAPAGTGTEMIQMQEQLEALKLEKEQLQQRLGTSEGQMGQMEELLRLKDEQIAQLEQLVAQIGEVEQRLEAATGPNAPAEAEKPVGAQASRPPAPVPTQAQPEDAGGLMATLTNPVTLGAGGLVALLVALLIGRQRRRREQEAELQPVIVPETQPSAEAQAPASMTAPIVAAALAAGGAVAAGLEEQEAPEVASDPVQAVLDEVDVMQAYGLHDVHFVEDRLHGIGGNLGGL